MRRRRTVASSALLVSASLSLLGCAGFYEPLEELVGHESAFVSVPATVGAVVAGAVGVPVAVLALPITMPASAPGPGGPNLLPMAPVFATAQVGAVMMGSVPWLLALPFRSREQPSRPGN